MPSVYVNKDEPIEKAIRRLTKMVSKEGIIQSVKKNRFYEKPSEKKRRARARTRKK